MAGRPGILGNPTFGASKPGITTLIIELWSGQVKAPGARKLERMVSFSLFNVD